MTRDLVIDCHADTLLKKYMFMLNEVLFKVEKTYHVSRDLLLEGEIDIQVFALFIPPKLERIAIEITLEMIQMAKEMVKRGDFNLIKSQSDLNKIKETKNTLGMILSIEGALTLERNIKILPIFWELGVRNIGLAWSRKNLFAEGVSFTGPINGEGLSIQGKDLIEEMDKLGMIIDVSHLNHKGFSDVVKITSNPFIASHSNSYHICPVNRNLTDDQLMDIASADGVVGMNYAPSFLTSTKNATINDVINHIKYISEFIGVDYVGLGSDFDGIAETPKGLENASEVKKIPSLLEKEGFTDQDIAKIMGRNFERVFTKVWK